MKKKNKEHSKLLESSTYVVTDAADAYKKMKKKKNAIALHTTADLIQSHACTQNTNILQIIIKTPTQHNFHTQQH
jgi:hypothetical protein